jgi:hypothetical protein
MKQHSAKVRLLMNARQELVRNTPTRIRSHPRARGGCESNDRDKSERSSTPISVYSRANRCR